MPKQRLTELFNVNQFIVSQVNPLAPLFIPPSTGLLFVEETLLLLKHQLVGFVSGISQLGQGRLVRPMGLRVADLILQDYEGTVTIYPNWSFSELLSFLSNFDERRIGAYMLDGERATWPHIALIRSLCEVEFTLDEVAKDISRSVRVGSGSALSGSLGGRGATETAMRGKLPSYMALEKYAESPDKPGTAPYPVMERSPQIPSVTSHASLMNLAALDCLDLGGVE